MLEIAAVFTLAGGLALIAAVVALVPPLTLLWGAVCVMSAGLLLGVPAGLLYHVWLRRELLKQGGLPPGFYLRPHAHHERLGAAARRQILPAFYAGALGFCLILLGAALATVSLATHFR